MPKEDNSKQINARVMKWLQMAKKGLYSDGQLLSKRVRKGIPPSIRLKIWPQLIKMQKLIQKFPLTYSTLLLKDSYDIYDINLDVPRTFSFESQQVLRDSLFNVLKGLSIQFPFIGYCQGMNFLAMRLLEVVDDGMVFYLLTYLIKKYKSLYDNFRNPGYVTRQNQVFSQLFHKFMPKLYARLKQQCIEPVMYTPSLFLTLFSKILQKQKFYRFFQCLLVQGYSVIYKTALGLMKLKQKQLLKNNMQQNLLFVSNSQYYTKFTGDEFINTIFSFQISTDEIINSQKQYTLKNKQSFKLLQQSVKKTFDKKVQQPRNVIEWTIEDFKKSQFQYVNFQ